MSAGLVNFSLSCFLHSFGLLQPTSTLSSPSFANGPGWSGALRRGFGGAFRAQRRPGPLAKRDLPTHRPDQLASFHSVLNPTYSNFKEPILAPGLNPAPTRFYCRSRAGIRSGHRI
jgi:hypothetical protein